MGPISSPRCTTGKNKASSPPYAEQQDRQDSLGGTTWVSRRETRVA